MSKKEWNYLSAKEDYKRIQSNRFFRKCTNCKYGTVYAHCIVKENTAFDKGQLRAKFCKYYTKEGVTNE